MDILHIAKLANLVLSPAHQALFSTQLDQILAYISYLQQLDLKSVQPVSQSIVLSNISRSDTPVGSCLKASQNYYKTTAVFDND